MSTYFKLESYFDIECTVINNIKVREGKTKTKNV